MLKVDLSHRHGDFALDATFEVAPGVTAIFGPSGSGKTTIINAIAGLLHPDRARIELKGKLLEDTENRIHVPVHKRRIGYVFQDGRLFPHLSVARNLSFGTRFATGSPAAPAPDVIRLLGLSALLDRLPGTLSGGERQRVALGRALLSAPDLLAMDEPLAALDGPRKDEVLPYLEALRDRTGLPILYVSHSVEEVARLSDRMILVRDGRVRLNGKTNDILNDPRAIPFLGVREAGSLLRGQLVAHHPDGLSELALSGGRLLLPEVEAEPGDILSIRILAQDVLISLEEPKGLSSRNILPAVIHDIHRGDGPGVALSLRIGEDRLLARITARAAEHLDLRPGLACFAIIKATTVPRRAIGRVAEPETDINHI